MGQGQKAEAGEGEALLRKHTARALTENSLRNAPLQATEFKKKGLA